MSGSKRAGESGDSDSHGGSLSPTRRKKPNEVEVVQTSQPRLYIIDTLAGVSIIWSERECGSDAYLHPLILKVEAGDVFTKSLGLFMIALRRHDSHDNVGVTNVNNGYFRRVLVRVNQHENETTIQRRIVLSQIAAVCTVMIFVSVVNSVFYECCYCSS